MASSSSSQPAAVEFLEQLQATHPELSASVGELISLYQRKLWHQLTVALEQCFSTPGFNAPGLPLRLYTHFLDTFANKINLLRLSHIAVHVSKSLAQGPEAIAFLQSVVGKLEEMKSPKAAHPILFLKMHLAQQLLETDRVSECKGLLEGGAEALESQSDVDPSVNAALYYVSSLYDKSQKNYAAFYTNSLKYLSYVSSDTLPYDFKLALAVDISLAAILGEHVYNFAQLLMHPIIKILDNTQFSWLHDLLNCFNTGDLHAYDELCVKHAAQMNAQPALVQHERRLREKIIIACLMELVSNLPAENRRISLDTIAQKTKLPLDGVEFVLMKSLSLQLIKGTIDQVEGFVQITRVQPRILTKSQIQNLKVVLDSWISKVNSVSLALEGDSFMQVAG